MPRENTKEQHMQQIVDKGDKERPPTTNVDLQEQASDSCKPASKFTDNSFKLVKNRKKRWHPITVTYSMKMNKSPCTL